MKKKLTLLILFGVISLQAQTMADCEKKQQVVDSLIEVRQFDDALISWTKMRADCKALPLSFFTAGEQLMKYQLEIAAADKKDAAIGEVVSFYNNFSQLHPDYASANQVSVAMLLYQNEQASSEKLYELLDKAFKKDPHALNSPHAIYLYFELFFQKYKGDEVALPALLNRLDTVETHILNLKNSVEDKRAFKNVQLSIKALTRDEVTCENIVPHYKANLSENRANKFWLQAAAARLMDQQCHRDSIFIETARLSHALQPTLESAKQMALIATNQYDDAAAENYYLEAVSFSTSSDEKADIYLTLASSVYSISDKAKAKLYTLKALQLRPDSGRAYLFLAQLYASADRCGGNEFERKAIYFLASQMAKKAAEVDSYLKPGATALAARYAKEAPTTAEIKAAKMGGKKVAIKCWINESITIPK